MNNYKLNIEYDGSRYKGWQRLGDDKNTIQGKIEEVLSKMIGGEIQIIGSSRTDAGVHALNQVANFKTNKELDQFEIQDYLNKYLPNDINIKQVKITNENFHARYNAKEKTYIYKIWNKKYSNPFARKYSMHVQQRLDIRKMKEASNFFIGEHDFTAFSNAKSKKKSMVREIYSIDIEEKEGFIEIRIKGNGFLYNMVRKIVGALIEVGLRQMKAKDISRTINSKERNQINILADACGLYLEKIEF
ncbi:MAG: tRNA pseudouridine(38-40) synthase TruA [Senegalia sp. (in: firmicutes)]|uniref:tRNA pseudouridine(38-40) synthase TruA n=1 Tax=Senegalia sp. (in: firmicutes) TaxID=1924098 RepID=UPI003F980890